jgi:flagellar motor switch protein FliM
VNDSASDTEGVSASTEPGGGEALPGGAEALESGDDAVLAPVIDANADPEHPDLEPFTRAAGASEAQAVPPAKGEPLPYDFNRPRHISRPFSQNLRNLAENLAKMTSITFTNMLRANTVLEYRGLSLRPCGDYLRGLPNPTCVATVSLAPLKGVSLLHLDLGLCFLLLKKLMGGATEPDQSVREFTEIERGVFRNLSGKLLGLLQKASARLLELQPAFVSLENNPDYLTGLSTGDMLVCLNFQLMIEAQPGALEIGIPLAAFEPVREHFDPEGQRELRTAQEVRRDRRRLMETLHGTSCDVIVKLGELDISLESLIALQEGDLIPLKRAQAAPLTVCIAGKAAYLGEAGSVRQNRAVKLTEQIREE